MPGKIKEAFHIASTGRPGPVVIDIPVDVQNDTIDFKYPENVDIKGYKPTYKGHPMQIRKAAAALENAKRPVICAGGGVVSANASEELRELAEKRGIPVITTLMGIGSMPSDHLLHLGMVGSHGSPIANYILHHSDLVLILGARVGDRAIGTASALGKRAVIIHIDIDPAEIGKNIDATIPVVGDVKLILKDMLDFVKEGGNSDWNAVVDEQKRQKSVKPCAGLKEQYVNPKYLLSILSEYLPEDAIICTEVGRTRFGLQITGVRKPKTFITSGVWNDGYGCLGNRGETGHGCTVVVVRGMAVSRCRCRSLAPSAITVSG